MNSPAGRIFTSITNAVYFSLSTAAFLFLFTTYAGLTLISVPLTLLSITYVLALACAVYGLVRRDFLVGSSVYVLSRTTQRVIRTAALLLPLPALAFSAMFFNCLMTYDGSYAGIGRVIQLNHIEIALFGKSAILPLLGWQTEVPRMASVSEIDYAPYITRMQERIKQHWNCQMTAAEHSVVQIKVQRDGSLCAVAVAETSGSDKADQLAMDAVRASAPFEALPAGAPDNIDIQYTFNVNPESQQQAEQPIVSDQF